MAEEIISLDRLNAYRVMWVFVLFDLPVETKAERKAANTFRKDVLKLGFGRFQLSAYQRVCCSREVAVATIKAVKRAVPDYGTVSFITITDRQFTDIETYRIGVKVKEKGAPEQLTLF